MTIVERLKKLIVARGGSANGVTTIEKGVKKLTDMENAANPLSALKVDVDIGASTDLLGKVVGDLQKDIVVGVDKITGTSKYVTGYTGFSGDTEEQSGNYLALHASVPDVSDVTIKTCVSTKSGVQTMDPDGLLVHRIRVKDGVRLSFIASKSGYPDYRRDFDISGLTLEPEST